MQHFGDAAVHAARFVLYWGAGPPTPLVASMCPPFGVWEANHGPGHILGPVPGRVSRTVLRPRCVAFRLHANPVDERGAFLPAPRGFRSTKKKLAGLCHPSFSNSRTLRAGVPPSPPAEPRALGTVRFRLVESR